MEIKHRNDLKKEVTLGTIAENPEVHNHSLFFGIIVDYLDPIKYDKEKNFVTCIKIIDPSFNFK